MAYDLLMTMKLYTNASVKFKDQKKYKIKKLGKMA